MTSTSTDGGAEKQLTDFCPYYAQAVDVLGRRWMGVVLRVLPSSPVRVEYELTAAGRDLECVVREIAAWSQKWLANAGRP